MILLYTYFMHLYSYTAYKKPTRQMQKKGKTTAIVQYKQKQTGYSTLFLAGKTQKSVNTYLHIYANRATMTPTSTNAEEAALIGRKRI